MSYAGRSPTSFITRRSASRTDHLLQRRATIVAVEAAEELHQLDDQLGARVDRRRFEQRLLRRRVERRDLRDTVDQRRVVELTDRIPVDDIALPLREALGPAPEARALDAPEHGFRPPFAPHPRLPPPARP